MSWKLVGFLLLKTISCFLAPSKCYCGDSHPCHTNLFFLLEKIAGLLSWDRALEHFFFFTTTTTTVLVAFCCQRCFRLNFLLYARTILPALRPFGFT